MKIRFLGPLGRVTGSCTWLRDEAHGWNLLVDCGLRQGERDDDAWNRAPWPFKPEEITAVILTHAHLDHCGLLPALYRDEFMGSVYCTKETKELARIVLEDAARLGEAPYKPEDVERIPWGKWHEHAGHLFGCHHPIAPDLFIRHFRAGHIVGAVSTEIAWGRPGAGQRRILFSGDLGPDVEEVEQLPLLRHRMAPGITADFAVIESTYGGRVRSPVETDATARLDGLRALVDDAVKTNGVLVLPCFAIGRTQDVLFDLHCVVAENPSKYRGLSVIVDGPMAGKVSAVVANALERTESVNLRGKVRPPWLGKQVFRTFGLSDSDPAHIQRALDLVCMALLPGQTAGETSDLGNALARNWRPIGSHVSRGREREALLATGLPGPTVVVTSGGMCGGGPVVDYLHALLREARTVIALPGFCSANTPGGQLLRLRMSDAVERGRHTGALTWSDGRSVPVSEIKSRIEQLRGYSAHADQNGLLDWLFLKFKDRRIATGKLVFVQHGDDTAREALAGAINEKAEAWTDDLGFRVHAEIPKDPQQWYDLDHGGEEIVRAARRLEVQAQMAALQAELSVL